jgi:radical SAM protein with 4Fe4S-binding SPASM domain
MIAKLRNLGVRRLDFTGRESFMYSDFVALASWAKQQGFELRVNTNGTFAVSDVLSSVDEIIFSVHGLRETHDQITKNRGAFSLIEENIQRTVKAGVKASINMSLLRSNYEQLNEVYNYFAARYDINKFAPSFPIASLFGSEFADEELILSRELVSDYVARLKMVPAENLVLKHGFHSIFIDKREHYHDNGLLLPNCAAGKHKLIVESDGRVFPCNFFKSEEFFCGNLLTGDEFQIWKFGAGFNRFRELILEEKIPGECANCLKKPRCYSGCRAWSLTYKEGGFENVKDKRCDLGSAFIGA